MPTSEKVPAASVVPTPMSDESKYTSTRDVGAKPVPPTKPVADSTPDELESVIAALAATAGAHWLTRTMVNVTAATPIRERTPTLLAFTSVPSRMHPKDL